MVGVEIGMAATRGHSFWRTSPLAAKWALATAGFLLLVAVIPFIVLTVVVTQSEHVSPMTAIFGPGPGNAAIVWLYFTVMPAAIQASAGLALRHSREAARVAGLVA